MSEPSRPSGRKRVSAYLADSILIFAWIGALTFIGFTWGESLFDGLEGATLQWAGHAFSFFALTAPVILYFALLEASPLQASLGKAWRRLELVDASGKRAGLGRTLLRNALKFLPWELAHSAIWHVPGQPFVDPVPTFNIGVHVLAISLACLYVLSLFRGSGRTPYDLIAGTRVRSR